jgi:PmbA protein
MNELQQLAESIAARADAGEQLEAYVAKGSSTSVRAYEGEVEDFTSAQSSGLGIRVVRDHRQGFASGGSLATDVIDEVLAEARDNARYAEPDEYNGLAEPDGVSLPDLPESVLWRDGLADFPTEAKIDLAIELERRVRGGDPRITGVRSAGYGDGTGEAAIATSTGISAWGRGTSCSLGVSALAKDGEETQTGGGSSVAREPADLDLDEAATDAIDRATRLLGATQPDSESLTIVLEPRLAATLIGIVGGTLSGERVIRGRTPFADREGETIASPLLTVIDDPTDPESFGADYHDGEGLAARRNRLITNGVLDGFLDNAYTARHRGTTSTASAVRSYRSRPGVGTQAVFVEPGDRSPEELLAGVDRGLLVQSLTGLHSGVNAVSGDFSVGADGVLIVDGAEAGPVREVTLASTIQRLLLDIVAIGNDLERRPGGTSIPTLVIEGIMMSGR